MSRTLWFDELHDRLLDREDLHALELRAAQLYDANPHIFEDAREALRALGVVPLLEAIRDDRVSATPMLSKQPHRVVGRREVPIAWHLPAELAFAY